MSEKLSRTQSELLAAMRNGVVLNFMPYMGRFNPQEYYYRSDTHKRCTAAARALEARGLVERVAVRGMSGEHELRIKS